MSVEYVAPPGFAKIEEQLSIKLNLHMIALAAMLGNTQYVCQAYMAKQQFRFKDHGDVRTKRGTDNVDLIVKAGDRKIKYQYKYRHAMISQCIMYDEAGKEIDADVKTLQASYEAVVDYCTAVMVERMVPAQEVEPTTTTETN